MTDRGMTQECGIEAALGPDAEPGLIERSPTGASIVQMDEIVFRKWTVRSTASALNLTGGGPHDTQPRDVCAHVAGPRA